MHETSCPDDNVLNQGHVGKYRRVTADMTSRSDDDAGRDEYAGFDDGTSPITTCADTWASGETLALAATTARIVNTGEQRRSRVDDGGILGVGEIGICSEKRIDGTIPRIIGPHHDCAGGCISQVRPVRVIGKETQVTATRIRQRRNAAYGASGSPTSSHPNRTDSSPS